MAFAAWLSWRSASRKPLRIRPLLLASASWSLAALEQCQARTNVVFLICCWLESLQTTGGDETADLSTPHRYKFDAATY